MQSQLRRNGPYFLFNTLYSFIIRRRKLRFLSTVDGEKFFFFTITFLLLPIRYDSIRELENVSQKMCSKWQQNEIEGNLFPNSPSIVVIHDTTNGTKRAQHTTKRTNRSSYRNWFNEFSIWLCVAVQVQYSDSISSTPTTSRWNTLFKIIVIIPPTNTRIRSYYDILYFYVCVLYCTTETGVYAHR